MNRINHLVDSIEFQALNICYFPIICSHLIFFVYRNNYSTISDNFEFRQFIEDEYPLIRQGRHSKMDKIQFYNCSI
jgi:hypothetical protein